MIEAPNVDKLMAGSLGRWLREQDSNRQQTKNEVNSRKGMWLAILCVLVFGGQYFENSFAALSLNYVYLLLLIACFYFGLNFIAKRRRSGVAPLKQRMNSRIAEALGLTFSVAAPPGPEFRLARVHRLLPRYHHRRCEDLWQGNIGASAFRLYQAHLTTWKFSLFWLSPEPVFDGVIIEVAFGRSFNGVTLLERAGEHSRMFGLRNAIRIDGRMLEQVKMVAPRFKDSFTCWSSDQTEARYLIHPVYVERLIALEQAMHGKHIRALFHGGSLLIILDTGDLFESGSLDAVNDRRLMKATINQFVALQKLAAALNEPPRG